jgi:hypothetical protein
VEKINYKRIIEDVLLGVRFRVCWHCFIFKLFYSRYIFLLHFLSGGGGPFYYLVANTLHAPVDRQSRHKL